MGKQMNVVILIVLIISVAGILYTYIGYPALLYWLSRWFGRETRAAEITPSLSVIIAAYNEEKDIAQKLDKTLALDYPKDKLEIVVASDCSTDRTDEIVCGYREQNVR